MDFSLTDENNAVFDMAYEFGQEFIAPYALAWEKEGNIPKDLWVKAGELGLGGIYVSEEFGGSGLDRFSATLIFEALAMACPSVGSFLTIHNMCGGMIEKFGSLYGALEECAITETALSDSGFSGDWMKVVTELAIENIVPPFVEIRGIYDIEVWGPEGVQAIRETLAAAESVVEDEEEVTLTCHYNGAPHYRIDIRAPDYSLAESAWEAAKKITTEKIKSVEGSISIERL